MPRRRSPPARRCCGTRRRATSPTVSQRATRRRSTPAIAARGACRRDRAGQQPAGRRADGAARRDRPLRRRRPTSRPAADRPGRARASATQLAECGVPVPPRADARAARPMSAAASASRTSLYPEWVLLLWAARRLGRPVRWVAERAEEFVTSAQGRDNRTRARLALDARRAVSRARRRDGRQSRRLSLDQRAGQLDQLAGQRDGRRLRHPGGLHGRARRLHQHRADRRLSRRRQARGQLPDRAAGRRAPRGGSASIRSSCAGAT